MAVATRKENVSILANTNTFDGPGKFRLLLVAGSDAASVSLTVDGVVMTTLAAPTNTSECTPCIILGSRTATVALTGTAAAAYAFWE